MTSNVDTHLSVIASASRRLDRKSATVAQQQAAVERDLARSDDQVARAEELQDQLSPPASLPVNTYEPTPKLLPPHKVPESKQRREFAQFGRETHVGMATNIGSEVTIVTQRNLQYRAESARARAEDEYRVRQLDILHGGSSGLWNNDDRSVLG